MKKDIIDPSTKTNPPMQPVHPEIMAYLDRLFEKSGDSVVKQMEDLALKEDFPIVGRQVGLMLKLLALSIHAKRIFEFGSGYGYSAYWFAQGMDASGKIICSEGDQENERRAKHFLSEAGVWSKIDFRVGWAQEIFKTTDGEFDIIYNDVDKNGYPEVWDMARARLRPGGLYICDNTLWSGRVAQEQVTNDVRPGWTEAIRKHNEAVANDPHFDSFLNPVRDGVIVARRKS